MLAVFFVEQDEVFASTFCCVIPSVSAKTHFPLFYVSRFATEYLDYQRIPKIHAVMVDEDLFHPAWMPIPTEGLSRMATY